MKTPAIYELDYAAWAAWKNAKELAELCAELCDACEAPEEMRNLALEAAAKLNEVQDRLSDLADAVSSERRKSHDPGRDQRTHGSDR